MGNANQAQGEPEPGELPEGWRQACFTDVASCRMGKTILARHLSPSGIPVYSAGRENHPWGFLERSDLVFGNRTLVLSARGSIGFPKLPNRRRFVSTQTTIAATFPSRLLAEFACYWLQTVDWSKVTSGATIPMLTIKHLEGLKFPVPPESEQQRIVRKVDDLLAHVNGAREHLARMPAILKRFRQSVVATAFSGHLTEDWRANQHDLESGVELLRRCARVTASDPRSKRLLRRKTSGLAEAPPPSDLPAEWGLATVRELLLQGALLDFQDGNHGELYPRKEDFGGLGVKFLTAAQVMNNRVLFEDTPRLKDERASTLRIGFAQPGDVLLTHNATVGRVAVLPGDAERCILGTSVTYYRFRSVFMSPEFVCYAMQSELWQRQLRMVMEQTTRNQVSVKKQIELWLPVAPIAEQREIVRRVEALFALADTIEQRVATATARADGLTQAILAKAFRGELVPTDAELATGSPRQEAT